MWREKVAACCGAGKEKGPIVTPNAVLINPSNVTTSTLCFYLGIHQHFLVLIRSSYLHINCLSNMHTSSQLFHYN